MSLSEKEKKKIDEIENAVRKETPVENLKKDRKDREFEKQRKIVPPMMGYMIPPLRREPGVLRLFFDLILGRRPMMGIMPAPPRGKQTPRPSDEDEPPRHDGQHEDGPESAKRKKKHGKDGKREA